jgi:hypothetical protein
MLANIISVLYEKRKSTVEPPIPINPRIAPKQNGQSFAENKVPITATNPVPVFFARFPLIFSLCDAYNCIAIEMPNSEENKTIKPMSFNCKIDNWNCKLLPGVRKEGIKIATEAITKARAIAMIKCLLELRVMKIDLNTDFIIFL